MSVSKKRAKHFLLFGASCIVVFLFVYYYSAEAPPAPASATHPEEPLLPEPVEEAPSSVLTFSTITLSTDTPAKEIIDAVGLENFIATLSLNRVDERHLQKGALIVIPSSFEDLFALSGFPKTIQSLTDTPKVLLVSQEKQEFGAYEYGQLVRFGGISTGKKSTPTASKRYTANWKAKETISTVNDEWLLKWNVNIENIEGIGIHEYGLPGYPASHSCIRFSALDAKWFYDWVVQWKLSSDEQTVLEQGTPVYVFGTYNFGSTAPWKKLPEDPDALKIDLEMIELTLDQ